MAMAVQTIEQANCYGPINVQSVTRRTNKQAPARVKRTLMLVIGHSLNDVALIMHGHAMQASRDHWPNQSGPIEHEWTQSFN